MCLFLAGCGWVDSTGRVNNTAPVTELFLDGSSGNASAVLINEFSTRRILASSNDADGVVRSYRWSEQPVEQGQLNACAGVENFDFSRAVNSLEDACVHRDNCTVSFEQDAAQDAGQGQVEFLIRTPALRAPVGVSYTLSTTDNDGGVSSQQSTFCMMSMNEAPDAVPDQFSVLENDTLVVTAGGPNLLSNDSDDIDTSNKPLRVKTTPRRAPRSAALFELRADGGFTYKYRGDAVPDQTTDSFEYEVTDGEFTSWALVTLRIVARDDPPKLTLSIPLQSAIAGVPYELDLSRHFTDPESSELTYAVAAGSLPPSGGITLSATGLLAGTATPLDTGRHDFSVVASDGSGGASSDVELVVANNKPIQTTRIPTQSASVGERFVLDVSDYFTDPEDQPITFSLTADDDDAELTVNSRTGVVTGFFTDSDTYEVSVFAADGFSTPSRINFVVDVASEGEAPVAGANIADQRIELGDSIIPVSGEFTDPDGDSLTISLSGVAPTGIRVNSRGVLSGTPTQSGVFSQLRLVARDSSGQTARTNAFAIVVNPPSTVTPTGNEPPEFTIGSVFNQGLALGSRIAPVRPEFTDPDDDRLQYAITGAALPAGVSINRNTGVVSGRPTARGWAQGLRITATDTEGLVAVSDPFWIRVF